MFEMCEVYFGIVVISVTIWVAMVYNDVTSS